ncbi:MAG: hypothetical protein U0Y10_20095 [Spirosomataceae bacterium]
MKKLILILSIFGVLVACKKSQEDDPYAHLACSGPDSYLKDKASIQLQMVGIWKLHKISVFGVVEKIPNVGLTFLPNNQVQIAVDDQLIYKGAFEFKEQVFATETIFSVDIPTWNYQTLGDNYVRGAIRMCTKELLIDQGMASDGPGYFFAKIGNI